MMSEPEPLQRRLWFLEQLDPGNACYLTPGAVRLRGHLDQRALAEAVAELGEHAALRTRCVDRDGVPVVLTSPHLPPLQRVSATGVDPDRAARDLVGHLTRTLAGTAPAGSFAAGLAGLGTDDHLLLVALHQAAGSAVEVAGLLAELGVRYTRLVTNASPEPPAAASAPGQAARAPAADPAGPDEGWHARLAAAAPAEAPITRQRPRVWGPAGRITRFPVPTGFLPAGAPGDRPTAAMLLAVVHTLLARHSGRWDGVIGVRVGEVVVPVPMDLPRELPFDAAVAGAAEALARARRADAERLAPDLAGGTDLSRNPLFDVLVEVVDEPATEFVGLSAAPVPLTAATTRYDLVVRLRRRADRLTGEIEYSTALLSPADGERLAARLAVLCASAAASPATAAGRLEVLPAAERRAVLPPPGHVDPHTPELPTPELIARQAAATPDAVAVECGDQQLSYRELLARADALAGELRGYCVGPGELVGVAVPRGVDLLASLIGVWRSGAAYLPLDPEHPAERLSYLLSDAGVRLLVTAAPAADVPLAAAATVVRVDHLPAGTDQPTDARDPVMLDDPAFVIYTSGSTGRPKGVCVTHRALANLLGSMRERPGLAPGTVFPAVTTVSFDIAALELFLPLLVGGRVVVSDAGEARDPDRLAALLTRSQARVMQATPVTWRLLLDTGWTPPAGFTAWCGGERLPPDLAGRLCTSGVRLWDLYGPTETTIWSAVASVEDGAIRESHPVARTTLYVLDDWLQPVPLGGHGELYIGGTGVAVGYLGRPGLTADRFLPDPYGTDPGARLYRTGDVACRHPDGRIEILGRTDHQLKIRGFRVEPAEIEHVLAGHPGVSAAAVAAVAGAAGELRLVGYICPERGAEPPAESELKQHCDRQLPPYLIPAQFVVLAQLPTTPNGKVDRAALPAPGTAPAPPGPPGGRPPATPAERLVAEVLADVLDRPGVGADEDFFALGGHSLLATQAVSRLRARTGTDLPVTALFEVRTAAGLAARLAAAAERPAAPVALVPRTGPLPLSYAQRRMWFLHQLYPDATGYLEPLAVPLPDPLDPDRLRHALTEVFARHEILRTRYHAGSGGEAEQVVDPPAPVEVTAEHGDPGGVLAAELARPIDLSAGPPVRLRLVRSARNGHTLLLVLHHIATDDRSHEVLARDLLAAYRGEPLPPLPVQYADYAQWQREQLVGSRLAANLGFWRDQLAGLEPTELLPDRPRPAVPDLRGGTARFTIPAAVVARLCEIGESLRATRFQTMLAGFLAILARYTGRTDLAVGIPVSGRDHPMVEDLVGLFVNTVVVRVRLPEPASDGPALGDLLAVVRARTLDAYRHADLPFELLVADLAPERDPSRNPLFGILFAMHGVAPQVGFPLPGPTGAKVDIGCHLTERPDGGLDGRIEYPVALFDEATVAGFARHFVHLLAGIAAAPETPLELLPLQPEPDQVLPAALPAPDTLPELATVPELIAARAAATGTVAVIGNGRSLTYPELDRAANQLAHRLRELGAGRDTVVVVRLPRSPELVVALLGVLRSGAAYLPLDPDHPAERLRHALAESAAQLLIAPADQATGLPDAVRLVAPDDPAEQALISAKPITPPEVALHPDDLAYVVYTSGSTGRPKGAMVTHGGLANYTRWACAALRPERGAGALLHTSLAYDLPLTALFPPLVAGAPVTLVDGDSTGERSGVEPLAAALERRPAGEPYGLVKLTPTHLDLLTEVLPESALAGATRCLVVAGEALRGEQLAGWTARAPATLVVNSYGPSEASIACAVHAVPAGEIGPGPVPIGRPIPGASLHLLDPLLRPVPPGMPGEIYVGGRGVGRGYLGSPGLTADRFVPDPLGTQPGARLYRTGDLARLRPDGTLLFLGRTDHQLKIRGFRVEPDEVASTLTEHPEVRAAAVVGDHSDPGNPRLAAHIVPAGLAEGDPAATVDALRSYLAARLPSHQVPTLWGTLPELPLLPNGKLDRRALPRLRPGAASAAGYEPPASTVERVVAEVWAEVLGVDRVGRHDRFFDLGGQSLLATRVVARLRERLAVPVTVRDLFTAQTVAALAHTAAGRASPGGDPAATAAAEIPPADRSRPLPLSFGQERLWFLDQLHQDSTEYLVATALRLRGPLRPAALERSLTRMVARHEILRTRYLPGAQGEPVQVIDPPTPVKLEVEEGDPQAVLREELTCPVDLATGPVWRARLLRVAAEEHVLTMVVHHIATDGWSSGVLAAELAAGYDPGETAPPTTAPPPVQYADYAAWQRGWLAGPVLERLLAYWRERLAGLEPTELPADRPRPAVRDPRGAVLRFQLPPALVGQLARLARRAGATPFVTYLAGFLALLGRYTGRRDLAVGVPVSGRTHPAVTDLLGCFVNTVVLRADLTGDPSFRRLVEQVRDAAVGAHQHDELPFERLVAELAPHRDLSRHPLFGVLFSFREEGDERFRLPGLMVTPEPIPTRTAKFDLTLELTGRADGGLTGEIEYATALFDPATVDRLAGHYRRLLAAAAAAPATPVGALTLLDDAEQQALGRHGRGPDRPRPAAGLPELFDAQMARTPAAVAVAGEGPARELTYRELAAAANRLAHHLRACGIGYDEVVGVCLPRCPDLVVALLAVLKAGAGFLPLDPSHPPDRLAWLLNDSGARLAIVDSATAGLVPAGGLPLLDLAAEQGTIAARPDGTAPVTTDPDGLAYLIYTSGSTGRPKGVAVPHRGIRNRVLWAVDRYQLGSKDRLLQKTSVSFDASVWEFLGPLVSGGTVVLPPAGTERDPAAMVEILARERVTVLQGVPSFLRTLADEPGLERCRSLRLLFSAGEPLPVELAARLTRRLPATLVNTYGPTECAIDVTAWDFPGDRGPARDPAGTVPIGRPLDNTRATVHAPDGRLVPVGVPGELHAAGEGLARGYAGQPWLTADRFVPDPYGPPGARAYRTGDLVKRGPDGVLEFLGRADHQVKIRGVRVELGEVEAVLGAHPAVAASVAAALPGPDGLPRLVGYLVTRADPPPHQALRDYLLARLPEPYVPSVIVTLDRLPLTASGKVDRAALPAPGAARPTAGDHEPVAARTPAEKAVADILAEVLGLELVGVTDDFFELGGHSLLAIRVASRLRAGFGVDLPVRAVFEDRTVAALADRLSRLTDDTAGGPVDELAGRPGPEITPRTAGQRREPAPLSAGQQRLWFLDRLDPGGTQYHVTWALRLTGRLDRAALTDALFHLLARHEALRTRYPTGPDGQPVQVVEPAGPVSLPVVDCPAEQLPAALRELADQPFDLAQRPPVRLHLLRFGPQEHVFLLVMHHIAGDGWSQELVARDLAMLYRTRTAGGSPALPPVPLQYPDYATWQRSYLAGDREASELAHWRERLAGLSPLELPTDRPRPPVRDGRGATWTVPLPAAAVEPLLALGRQRGATPFMTLLAAFAALLGRYTGSTDLAIGTVVSGRDRPELENVVGFFVNTVVVRVDLAGDPSLATLIDRVRERALDAFSHAELPFDRLVEELAPHRDLARSPLCDVTFGMNEQPPPVPELAGLAVEPLRIERTTAKFDLTASLTPSRDGGYELELEYATGLFNSDTVRRMASHFRNLVTATAAASPDTPVSQLEVLDPAERDRLLHGWNPPPLAPDPPECLPEAFAAQAARTPDAPAVVDAAGQRLTYAELRARAVALAGRLRFAGVGPEAPVAVYLDRSPAAVVVLLAVHQAGGVFVPLDPAQPAARLSLMLDDLRPVAVVTERRFLDRLAAVSVPILAVDDPQPPPDRRTPGELPPGDPDRLAYLVYTSGSTGRPKAVMTTHRAFLHHCRVMVNRYDIRAGDQCWFSVALTFEPALEQMAAPLLAGATVVVGEPGIVPPAALPHRLAAAGITHVALAPAYYREVMTGVQPHDSRLAGLRVIGVAGDVVTHDDARRWLATGLPARFVNVYGPTEATVVSLTHPVTVPDDLAGAAPEATLPIGRPLPGTRAYVLDRALQPVPVGVAGELYLGGPRLSRGYLRQPRLTADRFMPDPFGDRPGERLYRTGDQVRYRPDGVVEFLGRSDTQVKIRGLRIELGEVEATLAQHPAVRAAAATVQTVASLDRRLIGYVVPEPGVAAPHTSELRGWLRERLPDYMVPAALLTLDALPLNASQKVDRRALPLPGPGSAGLDPAKGAGGPPRTEVEEAIAEAWAEVLDLSRVESGTVGVADDFFSLGGHSLLATRLMARLQDRFGIEVPLRTLFEATTIATQAAALETLAEAVAAAEAPAPASPDSRRRPGDAPIPTSKGQ